jgi:hypothetical protein
MSLPALLETARKLLQSSLVLNMEFLGTKIRAQLPKGYTLYVWYNATMAKYSYTIVKQNRRIIGWDNAPHHKHVGTHPHHFHGSDGRTMPSKMMGTPAEDITVVLREAKKNLRL